MSSGVALYYPHIEFRDTTWLKWALLFWDRGVRRIVPSGYHPSDNSEVEIAVQERLIKNTDCRAYLRDAADEFKQHLDTYLVLISDDAPVDDSRSPTVSSYINIEGAMQIDKVDPELAELLISKGLARLSPGRRDNLRGPQPLVALLMTILARKMSDKIKSPIITDKPSYGHIAQEIIAGSPSLDAETVSDNLLQTILVPFVDPDDVRSLSMEQVLDIRRRHLPAIRRFREEIEGSISALTTETDPNAYQDTLSSVRQRISQEVKGLQDQLLADRLKFVRSVIGVSGVSFFNAAMNAMGHPIPPGATLTSIGAVFLFEGLLYAQQQKTERGRSGYQYVLSLGQETSRLAKVNR